MRDWRSFRSPESAAGSAGGPGDLQQQQQAQQALQQALSRMGLKDGYSPEALTELARRAGFNSPAQVADLGRMMGMRGESAAGMPVPQHIFFRLDEWECALPTETVQGVERVGEMTAVPNTQPWVLGVMQVWGSIISVVDLRRFLGMPAQPATPRSRILVVTLRGMTIGFLVDAVTEMRPIGGVAADPTASGAPSWLAPYLGASLMLGQQWVGLLDPERLLFAEKMHRYRAGD